MAIKRVTMQDIANKCGLSRNTISKVFNGRGNVPDETKELIYAAAKELGYSQFPGISDTSAVSASAASNQSIAVLSRSNPMHHSFGAFLIKAFTDQICRMGYTVRMYEISNEEIQSRILPPNVSMENTAGILCIELFDTEYLNTICNLGLPAVIVDGYKDITLSMLPCDVITMENVAASIALTQKLLERGAKTIGFVGDINHCNSFNERWKGFTLALAKAGLSVDADVCILDSDSHPYSDIDWLDGKLDSMPYLPDAFFCANDFHALHMIAALKKRGLSIPKDIMITGFDNSPESAIVEPGLTTAKISSTEIGTAAADMLSARIQNNTHSYQLTYVKSVPIFRESTR